MSIGRRFTLWAIFIVVVFSIVAAFAYYRFELSGETERLDSLGRILGPIIEESLAHYMLTKDRTILDKTLASLENTSPISRVWLINNSGKIAGGTDDEHIGTVPPLDGPICQRCHEKGRQGTYLTGTPYYRWVHPVRNRSQCHACHKPEDKYNGIIILDFSLSESRKAVSRDILMGTMVFIPSMAAIGFIMIWISRVYVIKRLNRVIEELRHIEQGDYSARVNLDGDDEITKLQGEFNRMARTITDREREKNLLLLQASLAYEQWHHTFDSITDLIAILDSENNIIRANRAFLEYFDLTSGGTLNKKCHELMHCSDCSNNLSGACPHVVSKKQNRPATGECTDRTTGRTLRVSSFPYHFREAGYKGYILTATDITEEKETKMMLIMAERLASLGQMASGVAHEINNPLASIAGCTESMLRKIKKDSYDPEEFQSYLNITVEEIVRCKDITTSMLSFVKKTAERSDLDLNLTVEKTLEIMGFQGRFTNVEVTTRLDNNPPRPYANENELRQVLMTVITNALDAMKERGSLTIETGAKANCAFVRITDTGPGVPEGDLEKIFDPFFTTKTESGGTGLGLPIAKNIITSYGGSITAANSEGEHSQGAVFTISLPVKPS